MSDADVLRAVTDALRRAWGFEVRPEAVPRLVRVISARCAELKIDERTYAQAVGPMELAHLADMFLPHETGFGRDEKGLNALVAALPSRGPVRVWVAGCASGEEAYSMGDRLMCLGQGPVEVWASDVSPAVIEHARRGRYSAESTSGLSEPQRARMLRVFNEHTREIVPSLLALVRFEVRAVLDPTWPPPGVFDAVVCRRVRMYLDASGKQALSGRLAEALRPGGLMLLGTEERLDVDDRHFEALEAPASLYRRRLKVHG